MSTPELCMLFDSILALLETNNTDKAIEVIKNGIKRIDKGTTSSSDEKKNDDWLILNIDYSIDKIGVNVSQRKNQQGGGMYGTIRLSV